MMVLHSMNRHLCQIELIPLPSPLVTPSTKYFPSLVRGKKTSKCDQYNLDSGVVFLKWNRYDFVYLDEEMVFGMNLNYFTATSDRLNSVLK